MSSDEVKGMKVDDLLKLDRDFVLDLLGIDISATRMKCALLSLKVLKCGVAGQRRRLGARDPQVRGGGLMAEIIDVCPLDELPPGSRRIVAWEDLEIGVFNCDGELLAIEDRCSHDDGPLAEGELDEGALHARVPAPRLAVRPAHGEAADPPRLRARRHLPRPRGGRTDQAGGRLTPWPLPK